MNNSDEPRELLGQISAQRDAIDELRRFLEEYRSSDYAGQGRCRATALAVAGVLENYYTATETILFRAAQVFGNRLDPAHWRAGLLNRLSTEVPGVRPRILSRETYESLDELRRFRHFKRYYFRLDYDWDRLDFVMKKLFDVHRPLCADIAKLEDFTRRVAEIPPAEDGTGPG